MTQENTHRVLTLAGAHGVRQAAQTHAVLSAAFCQPGDLSLDCVGVTEADLSLVQLILAAHRTAVTAGRHCTLSAPPAGVLQDVLQRGGFRHEGSLDPARWIDGKAAP